MQDEDWYGLTLGVAFWGLVLFLLTGCAIFSNRWAVPHATKLRPCVGTYVYPDSASVCNATKEER